MVNKLIQSLIAMVIGLALLPVVNDFASGLTETGGALEGTTTGSLVDLLPVIYCWCRWIYRYLKTIIPIVLIRQRESAICRFPFSYIPFTF